jgi:hypothetical protein
MARDVVFIDSSIGICPLHVRDSRGQAQCLQAMYVQCRLIAVHLVQSLRLPSQKMCA